MPFCEARVEGIVREMRTTHFLPGMNALTYRWYFVLDIRDEAITCTERREGAQRIVSVKSVLGVTALNNLMFMECDEETGIFFIYIGNSFICYKYGVPTL